MGLIREGSHGTTEKEGNPKGSYILSDDYLNLGHTTWMKNTGNSTQVEYLGLNDSI